MDLSYEHRLRGLIKKEDWKKAPGVVGRGTNSALAKRDYKVPCRFPHHIAVVKGYWIWWCSAHHQPLFKCDEAKGK